MEHEFNRPGNKIDFSYRLGNSRLQRCHHWHFSFSINIWNVCAIYQEYRWFLPHLFTFWNQYKEKSTPKIIVKNSKTLFKHQKNGSTLL